MNQSPAPAPGAAAAAPAADAPASLLALPVTEATLLEDRAELTRRAPLLALHAAAPADPTTATAPVVHRLRFGPVTPLLVDHSLRGELHGGPEGARVLDLRVVRRWSPQPPSAAVGGPGPDASEVERRVHELSEQLRRAELELSRRASRVAVLDQLLAELRREITETAGAGECEASASRVWHERLDRAEEEHDAQSELLRAARRQQARLKQELIQAQIAWGEAESRPPVLVAELEVTVELPSSSSSSEEPELVVRHLVPCALWRPAYRATLTGDEAELLLERDAFLWQRTGEDWTDVRVTLSTARPALASEPPFLPQDLLVLRDRSAEERRTIEVDLREVEIPDLGPDQAALPEDSAPAAPAPLVPGVDDGGEARRLLVPEPVGVPSDGRAHRVGLGGFRAPVAVELSCAAELSPLVFRTARFRNAAGQPLLSGPVDLVRGSGFVGRGELRFTAVDAAAELCFGSEDGFRVVRSVTETRGSGSLAGALTGRSASRIREVGVTLSRFAPAGEGPARVVLRERIPVSEVAAVEVRVDKDRTEPQPDVLDAEGVARWELSLGPDESRSVLLRYEILAARSVALPE